MESRWHNARYPNVPRTCAESDDSKLCYRHSTHVTRPPPPAEDPLGLLQSPGRRSRWCRLQTKE